MSARKPPAVGAHVIVRLYDGRVFLGVVKAIADTVAGRKFRVNHRDMTWKLDADQILRTVRKPQGGVR